MEYGGGASCLFEGYVDLAVVIVSAADWVGAGRAGLCSIRYNVNTFFFYVRNISRFFGTGDCLVCIERIGIN